MRNLALLLLVIIACKPLIAQEKAVEKEHELWTAATFKLKLNKQWRAEVEQQARFDDDVTTFDKTFTELGLRYEPWEFFNIKAQYRYSFNNSEHNEQRLSIDLNFEYDIPDFPLDIEYRLRGQDEKVSYTGEKVTHVRNLFGLDYNLSKLVDPYFEYESFYRFNQKNEFRENRFTLGLQWKINKDLELDTFYRIDREINVKKPDMSFIAGLSLSYDMKAY